VSDHGGQDETCTPRPWPAGRLLVR